MLKYLLFFQFVCLSSLSLSAQTAYDDIVDYENFDVDLFNETVSKIINADREKRHRTTFRYKEKLSEMAHVELLKRGGRYFRSDFRKKERLLKYLQKQVKVIGYQGSYIECSFAYLPVLQFDTKQKYIYKTNEGEQVDFFYSYSNRDEKLEIKQHSYLSLAKAAIKKMGNIGAKDFGRTKLYQDFGCAVIVEQKDTNRMPYIKVLCVLGGYRLGLLR